MKQCTRCKVLKDENEFDFHSLHENVLLKTCKQCNFKQKEYRTKTWQKGKQSRDKYYHNNKEKIIKVRNIRLETIEGRLKKLLSTIKYNEPLCDLDIEFLMQLYNKQNGECALTKIPMVCVNTSSYRTDPFMISIDRINSNIEHVKSNTRLVCVSVNFALNEWGEDNFHKISKAYLHNRIILLNE